MYRNKLFIFMHFPAKAIYMIVATLFIFLTASAQPKPGEESIVIQLPSAYRWKSKKIPKDTKAIRGTLYTVVGKNATEAPVDTVTITTIDKRYYPVKAEGVPQERHAYIQAVCPEAILEIVDKKTISGRTTILYTIKMVKGVNGECGSSVLLASVTEGPTALHTIELHIPNKQYNQAVFEAWCDTLLHAKIK